MKSRSLRLCAALLPWLVALSAPAWAGFTRVNESNPDDPMHVAIYRLDNGLTVYLTENHEAPRFYAEIAVRAGSKQDPPESTGLAHYLEHLLFKGTTRLGTLDYAKEKPWLDYIESLYEILFQEPYPDKRAALYAQINMASQEAAAYAVPNELDRLYNAMGGTALNAHTWHEEVVYKVDLPSNRLNQWAALESERFQHPVFRLFQTELETVFEEVNRALDNKMFMIHRIVGETLFKNHPYGQQPTIGKVEHIKNPSLRNIGTYYRTFYVPNNMAILISGDINTEQTIQTIDQYFSRWEPRELPAPKTWPEAPLNGREFVECNYEGEEYALLAFRTAPRNHPDAEALQVLDMILDNDAAGLINLNLNQQQRVRAAGSSPALMNDYGAQYLWGIPKDGQTLEEVERLLLEQLDLVRRGEFEDWILPAIINDFKKQLKGGLEDNTSRVNMIRDSYIGLEDWDRAVGYIHRLEQVTKADVMRVANQYFTGGYVAGFRRDAPHKTHKYEKPELAAIEIDPNRESAFGTDIAAMPVTLIEPQYIDPAKDFERVEDPNGVVYYYARNPINDLFGLTISVDLGREQDDRIGVAAALLDKAGTDRLAPDALSQEWYKLGTTFSMAAGDNETSISISGLDENFAPSVALLLEVLQTPKAAPETLEQLKAILLKQRADSQKQPETLARALFLYNRYGQDSPYIHRLSNTAVQSLTLDELLGLVRGLLQYRHAIFYTGSLPLDQVRAILDEKRPLTAPLQEPPPYRFLKARAPEKTEILFLNKEMAQAHVRLEFSDGVFDEALTPQIQVFNEYFAGGMAGLVFQELREARALAYSAGARYSPGGRINDESVMSGGIETQADKTLDAVTAFLDLMDNMPVSPDRFALAKESLINLYRTGKVGFREVPGIVRTWERQGLAPDPRAARFPVILESSEETLRAFHQGHIANRPKLISILGDKSKIDLEKLGRIAPVSEVQPEQLFTN